MASLKSSDDGVERLAIKRRCLATHSVRMYAQHAADVDPRGATLAIPPAGADGYPLDVIARSAGQLHGQQRSSRFARYDENRTVFAAAVVLLERHPGPDDLAGVRVAVDVRVVRGADRAEITRLGGRARAIPSGRRLRQVRGCGPASSGGPEQSTDDVA